MQRTIAAMAAGRWRWLDAMKRAKTQGLIDKIPTGRRRPGVRKAPSKEAARARHIASRLIEALPEPTKLPDEMDLPELTTEVFRLSLLSLRSLVDQPLSDDVRLARLQMKAALLLARLYFR